MAASDTRDMHAKSIFAGMFGNILEWYDFALYGFMAVIISDLFFAPGSAVTSLIATYGVFAIGFFARPIGGWAFGYVGDVFGRRPALQLSVLLMGLATFLLGCLPTYASIGLWAPVLLILLRLAQGLSVGGEFSTSVTYMVERADQKRRGFAGSFANIGSMGGMLLGAGAATLATTFLPHAMLYAWGWRLPFLFGGVLGLIGIALTRHLPAIVMHKEEKRHRTKTPFADALANNRRELLEAVAFSLGYAVFFYMSLVYLPTYANEFLHVPLDKALQVNTLAIALSLIGIPLAGYVSDRFLRRRTFLMLAFSATALLAIPAFLVLAHGTFTVFSVIQVLLALIMVVPLGSAPALYVELFPKEDRLTAYSITFNVSLGIFGGTSPLVATWLIHSTGNLLMPAYYLIVTLAVSLTGLMALHDRSREPLLE